MKSCKKRIASLVLAMIFLFFVVSLLSNTKHVCTHGDGVECKICEAYNEQKERSLSVAFPRTIVYVFVPVAMAVLSFVIFIMAERETPVLLKDKITG